MSETNVKVSVLAAAMSLDPRAAVAEARRAGFGGIVFDAIAATLDLTTLSQSGRREFSHLIRSSDLQLVGLRADLGPKGFLPGADVDRLLARLEKILEVANDLSAPLVCLDVGPVPEPAVEAKPAQRITPEQAGLLIIPSLEPAPVPKESRPVPGPDPAQIAHVDHALAEVCSLADRTSVTIAVRSDLASFAALHRAITAINCPWLAIDLDPVAVLSDVWPADEIFSRLGPLIRHVLARDATVGADKRTRPMIVGKGSTDWRKLLADLDAAGYRGWITPDPIELPDRHAAAIAGADFIRRALRELK